MPWRAIKIFLTAVLVYLGSSLVTFWFNTVADLVHAIMFTPNSRRYGALHDKSILVMRNHNNYRSEVWLLMDHVTGDRGT